MKALCKGTCGEVKYIAYPNIGLCVSCYYKQSRFKKHKKQYYENNKKYWNQHNKQYKENNKERWKEYHSLYNKQHRINNPEYWLASRLKYRGLLEGRTFPGDELALKNKIKEIRKAGLSVDHIEPLQGDDVCGLHVSWNLQGLTLEENASKGNRT